MFIELEVDFNVYTKKICTNKPQVLDTIVTVLYGYLNVKVFK